MSDACSLALPRFMMTCRTVRRSGVLGGRIDRQRWRLERYDVKAAGDEESRVRFKGSDRDDSGGGGTSGWQEEGGEKDGEKYGPKQRQCTHTHT